MTSPLGVMSSTVRENPQAKRPKANRSMFGQRAARVVTRDVVCLVLSPVTAATGQRGADPNGRYQSDDDDSQHQAAGARVELFDGHYKPPSLIPSSLLAVSMKSMGSRIGSVVLASILWATTQPRRIMRVPNATRVFCCMDERAIAINAQTGEVIEAAWEQGASPTLRATSIARATRESHAGGAGTVIRSTGG
jgi:hypothetical protein